MPTRPKKRSPKRRPTGMRMGRCRSCGADVYWVTMVSGNKMPLHVASAREVTVGDGPEKGIVMDVELERGRRVSGYACLKGMGRWMYDSHFEHCPHAAAHRRAG